MITKHNILLVILLIVFSTGCASDNNGEVEIKFWAMGAEAEYVSKLVPEFEKINPGIKVKVQLIPWTAAQEKLITAYASENTPDACQLGNTWVPQFAMLDALEPLNNRVEESNSIDSENYFKGIWDTNIIDSTLYGVPWYIDTRLLYYREDVLKKAGYDHPPETWEEFYDVSKKIKALYPGEDKYAVYLPTNEWAPFIIFGLQSGSSILKENNCYGNFNSDEFKKAFGFIIKFHKEKLAPIGISQVNNVYQAFADEYFSMYISGPWNVKEFKRWMKDDLADKWGTAPLPGPDQNTPGISIAGGSSLVMFKNSEHKDQVWKFFEYLSDKKTQMNFYKLLGDLPAVKSVWQDSVLSEDKYMRNFYTQFQNVKATPKIPEWEQIAYSKVQQYAEYAAREAMTIDEVLIKLDEDVDRILEKRRWLLENKKK